MNVLEHSERLFDLLLLGLARLPMGLRECLFLNEEGFVKASKEPLDVAPEVFAGSVAFKKPSLASIRRSGLASGCWRLEELIYEFLEALCSFSNNCR